MNINPLTPVTIVRVLKNVPLDNTYTDTLDFSSVSAQVSYFSGKTKYTYNNLGPVRMQNAIRLPQCADDIYDCNYIMFQNANFGSKWFYAFIKEIKFINVNMCEVVFELDAWQTWQFDITVMQSFVEREHINDDSIGNNLVEENLELGDYYFNGMGWINNLTQLSIVVAATTDSEGTASTGGFYGGVYSGLELSVFQSPNDVNTMIETLTAANKADAIVAIFMMPTNLVAPKNSGAKSFNVNYAKHYSNINGYTPKNNKLFTYPYNFLYVTNLAGNGANFRYEYFYSDDCNFEIAGSMTCNPQVMLSPLNYKGVSGANYNEKMVLEGYPQCPYTTDTFKAWLAQNGASTAVSVLGSAFSTIGGAVTGNVPAAVGGALGIASAVAKVTETYTLPPQARGATGSSANAALAMQNYLFYSCSITYPYAKIIDDYFSMYGYATHEVKVPNITGRPSWNYVKTIDVKIKGSVPFDDMATIKNMFNSGVTFWHGDWVGDYSRNNK